MIFFVLTWWIINEFEKLNYCMYPVNTFAQIESLFTFRVGFRSLMKSISFSKQLNLFLHFSDAKTPQEVFQYFAMLFMVVLYILKMPFVYVHPHVYVSVRAKSPHTVILLPLRPASLTHKNPQGRKVIHGTHLVGGKEWFFNRWICVWFKPEIKPTSAQIKRTIWPAYIIGQEVISEWINGSISTQISFVSKQPFWFTWWSGYSLCLPYMGSMWVTMVVLQVGLAKKDKKCHQKEFSTSARASFGG